MRLNCTECSDLDLKSISAVHGQAAALLLD